MIAEYKKIKAKEIMVKENFVTQESSNEVEFSYKPTKQKGFSDILGG